MGNVDNGKVSFEKLLFSSPVVNTQNTPDDDIEHHQIQPLNPPELTSSQLLSTNIAEYRDPKQFDGMKAYRYACVLRAQDQGVDYSNPKFPLKVSILWSNESADIKRAYINIAEQVSHIYNFHNGRFPKHKCKECPNHNA